MRALIVATLGVATVAAIHGKSIHMTAFMDSAAAIRTLGREKAECVHKYATERFNTLLSIHGLDNRDTREAELRSMLSLKDLEIARIREATR